MMIILKRYLLIPKDDAQKKTEEVTFTIGTLKLNLRSNKEKNEKVNQG